MSNTDALPALNVSDRAQSSEGQSNRFDGSRVLMESDSTDIFRQMTNDSMKNGTNDLLPNIGFSNGEPPNAPRKIPSSIEMYNNVPLNKPTDGGSSNNLKVAGKSGTHSNDSHSERSSGNRAGEQRLAGVQIIEDEEEQPADKLNHRDKSQDADSKNREPHPEKTGEPGSPSSPRDMNPVDRDSNPLHRERQPQERGDERREGPSHSEPLHNRKPERTTEPNHEEYHQQKLEQKVREIPTQGRETKDRPGEVSIETLKELEQLDISPEAKEISKDLADAYGKGNLKDIVDGLAEVVKENSKDPKTLKEAVDAFTKQLGKHGVPESMTVKDDGTLVLGSGALTIDPDGKVTVKPVRKVA